MKFILMTMQIKTLQHFQKYFLDSETKVFGFPEIFASMKIFQL